MFAGARAAAPREHAHLARARDVRAARRLRRRPPSGSDLTRAHGTHDSVRSHREHLRRNRTGIDGRRRAQRAGAAINTSRVGLVTKSLKLGAQRELAREVEPLWTAACGAVGSCAPAST